MIEKSVKTTMQSFYDKEILDNYDNAFEVLKDYLLIEVNGRRGPDLNLSKDDVVIQWFFHKYGLRKKATTNI